MVTENRINGTINLPDTIGRDDALSQAQRRAGFVAVQYNTTTYLMLHGTTLMRWYEPVSDTEIRVEALSWMPQDAIDDIEKLGGIEFVREVNRADH